MWGRDGDGVGPAGARNLGIGHASGRYLVFLDSDDLLPAWALTTYAQIIETDAPAIVMARVLKFGDLRELAALRPVQVTARRYADYLEAAAARYPVTIAVAVRRSLVVEAGGGESTSRDTAALHHSLRFVLREERRGRYPGGRARRGERRLVQGRKLGFAISRCLKSADLARGYDLYLRGRPLLAATRGRRDLLRLPLVPFRRRG